MFVYYYYQGRLQDFSCGVLQKIVQITPLITVEYFFPSLYCQEWYMQFSQFREGEIG